MSNTTLPRTIAHLADARLPGGMTDDLDPAAGMPGAVGMPGDVEPESATPARAKADALAKADVQVKADALATADAQVKAEAPKLTLSATAVAAGAMTATTSAMIGSHLGALGTLAGAAAGSVIGAVLSATYSFGLQRAHHALSGLHPPRIAVSRRGPAARSASVTAAAAPADINGAPAAPGETTTSATRSDASLGDTLRDPAGGTSGSATLPGRRPGARGMKVIAGVLATAALAFGATLLVITGFEKVTGGSLAGVQGATTIQHATRSADQGADQDATSDSAQQIQPAEVAPTPETPTATPTPAPSTTPSATPTPSAETPAPQASTTPSPSASPASQQAG